MMSICRRLPAPAACRGRAGEIEAKLHQLLNPTRRTGGVVRIVGEGADMKCHLNGVSI